MAQGRIMNRPADYQKLGINPDKVENWEDGRRDNDEAGHAEIWYLDCSLDDGSTLILGFRPKSTDQVVNKGDNPNVAINYTSADGQPFYDYRLYDVKDTYSSKDELDLKWGPSTLVGDNWHNYDIHIEPEADQELVMEGKKSVEHKTAVDLHFEAQVEPFRPGSGYIAFGENEEYYYNFICVTSLTVSGEVTINGEQKHVNGTAYYNHQWFNIHPSVAFHPWVWGRQNVGDYNVLIYDMVGGDRFGQPEIPLFTIDDSKGNRVFENTSVDNAKVDILDTYVQEETGKVTPKTIHYTFTQDDMAVEYKIFDPKEINLINVYGMASDEQKKQFDAMGLQPTYTRYLASTELKITRDGKTEVIDGSMLYEINYAAKEL